MKRRQVLTRAGAASVAGLAGCAYIPWSCASSVTLTMRPADGGTSNADDGEKGEVHTLDEAALPADQVSILEAAISEAGGYDECSEDGLSDPFTDLLKTLPLEGANFEPDGDVWFDHGGGPSGPIRFRSTVYTFSITTSSK